MRLKIESIWAIFPVRSLRFPKSNRLQVKLDTETLHQFQQSMVKTLHDTEDSARYYTVCGMDMARSCGEGLGRGLKPAASHWII